MWLSYVRPVTDSMTGPQHRVTVGRIEETLAGRGHEPPILEDAERILQRRIVLGRSILGSAVVLHARGVGEQVPDLHGASVAVGETGQVGLQRAVEIDVTGLDQLHHGRGGHRLGDRGDSVHHVGSRRQLALAVAQAGAPLPVQLATPGNRRRDADQPELLHFRFQQLLSGSGESRICSSASRRGGEDQQGDQQCRRACSQETPRHRVRASRFARTRAVMTSQYEHSATKFRSCRGRRPAGADDAWPTTFPPVSGGKRPSLPHCAPAAGRSPAPGGSRSCLRSPALWRSP